MFFFLSKWDFIFFRAVLNSQQNWEEGTATSHMLPGPYTCTAFPTTKPPHQSGTFITVADTTVICHYHPKLHSSHWTLGGLSMKLRLCSLGRASEVESRTHGRAVAYGNRRNTHVQIDPYPGPVPLFHGWSRAGLVGLRLYRFLLH